MAMCGNVSEPEPEGIVEGAASSLVLVYNGRGPPTSTAKPPRLSEPDKAAYTGGNDGEPQQRKISQKPLPQEETGATGRPIGAIADVPACAVPRRAGEGAGPRAVRFPYKDAPRPGFQPEQCLCMCCSLVADCSALSSLLSAR